MAKYELGIIGAGNMAEAMMRSAMRSHMLPKSAMVASEPSAARRQFVHRQLGVACVADNCIPAGCPCVLLAVKPQVMPKVLEEIAPAVQADATVITIAAGIRTALLDKLLGGRGRIVRVMPNTPLLVGCGMSAIAAGPRATVDDLAWAERLFSASGKCCQVDERLMDAVTAVSGTGPAYFFFLIETMIAAGVAEGLSEETAWMLSVQTCAGAARLLEESGQPPQVLRARVTTPGGTTQRAFETLEAAGVRDALVAAVRAAAARSRELGK